MMQQVLAGGLAGTLSDAQHDIFVRMQGRTGAMAKLISDLLDLEQLAARAVSPVRERVSLAESVRKAVDAVALNAEKKKVTIEISALGDLPHLIGDPDMIDSVTGNLLDNAVKYSNAGGLVSVKGFTEGREVAFEVTDNGIGIPEKEHDLLFEAFFRASNAQRAEIDGTGLGLTIVKRIVESHGGSIAISGAEGAGTTATVRFPVGADKV